MNILSVLYPLPFSPYTYDAMIWRVLNLRRVLEKEGHNVDLVYFGPTHLISDDCLKERIKTEYSYVPHFKEASYLKNGKYDLILCNHLWSAFNSSLVMPGRSRSMLDLHGLPREELDMNRVAGRGRDSLYSIGLSLLTYSGIKMSGRITCVSKRMVLHLHNRMKVPFDKMMCIPNGVDLNFFSPINITEIDRIRNTLGFSDKLIFGYLGGFQIWQGYKSLIEAGNTIEDDSIAFLIVGGNQRFSGRNTQILPKVSRDQVPLYYSICDVLVLPRPYHIATDVAAPTKFAEYAAMSKPILATDVGDAADYIREYDCGIVVKDDSPNSIRQGVKYMSELPQMELARMGKNSRRMAEEKFDWEKLGHTLNEFIS